MATPSKGEVRRLADAFPLAEAERVSKHVEDALQTQRHTLQTLTGYLKDNQELSKLVQELPNKITHNVMVPFGKAAFFPGRLVHTNEFLVFLGEGYYAECTAKQTVEILNRRGTFLDSKIAGINAEIADLQAESRFFNDTLAEVAAGVVEIREDFVDTSSSKSLNLEAGPSKLSGTCHESQNMLRKQDVSTCDIEDKEHEQIMARLSELEAAEAAELEIRDEEGANLSSSARGFGKDTKNLLFRQGGKNDGDGNQEHINTEELPERGKYADTMPPESSKTSWKQISDGCPSIRGPGDLIQFEEWRKYKSEKESVSKSMQEMPTAADAQRLRWDAESQAHSASSLPAKLEKAPLSPPDRKETQWSPQKAVANKAFSGTVLERNTPDLPAEISQSHGQGLKQRQTRPTSKFKMRQMEK